jgi:stage IV sporulation protein B
MRKSKGGEKINCSVKRFDRLICYSLTALIFILSAFNIVFFDIVSMDNKQTVRAGTELQVPGTMLGDKLSAVINHGSPYQSITVDATFEDDLPGATANTENYEAVISLYGVPVKTVRVEEINSLLVEAGGQSIGILLRTDGVSVVGFSPVILADGNNVNPASEARIETGDFITTINGKKINNNDDIAAVIEAAGKNDENCTIVFMRNGIKHNVTVKPLYCTDSQTWRIGLYVRDNTAGIGTLSFYEPESGIYGALGHEVPDLQYGVSGEEKGTIVRAAVQGIKQGAAGKPGEKLGVFLDEDWQGDIRNNSSFGIFGILDSPPEVEYSDQLLPVAAVSEAEIGKAEIYTVIEGEKIESFDIEIVKLMDGYKLTGKGMVIEITDPELLTRTGGIVQGMSGSPIIQNGMFIGAITHVFINDPTRGYACFGAWMMEDAGLVE